MKVRRYTDNNHPLYRTYQNIIGRCYKEKHISYKNYGARGIKMCDRWLYDFRLFVQDMGERPEGHSLDRIDNDGDYSPENCRWSDRITQVINSRRKISNSGYRGVCWDKNAQNWKAYISFDRKVYYLGNHDDFNVALKARREKEMEFYGRILQEDKEGDER